MCTNKEMINKKVYIAELLKRRKEFGNFCIHPLQSTEVCTNFSGAHNIQRNGPLKRIQKDNHILTPVVNGYTGKLELKKMGIAKQATVFSGVCNEHDRIFEEIEKNKLPNKLSVKQLFLFSYRAFAYSYFKVIRENYCYNKIFEKYEFDKNDFIRSYEKLLTSNVKSMKKEKTRFDHCIVDENYNLMTHFTMLLDYKIEFAVSTSFTVNYDIYGTQIEHSKDELDLVYFTLIPDEKKSYIMISWFKEFDDIYETFYKRLCKVPRKFIIKYLNNILPLHAENIVINPDLWEKWTGEQKLEFTNLIEEDLLYNAHSRNRKEHFKERKYMLFSSLE